jgi:hypothetical protein
MIEKNYNLTLKSSIQNEWTLVQVRGYDRSVCECCVQRGRLGGVLVCNRCWRTRGGRPIRLGNRPRRIPTETSRRIKVSCTRVNDPTHQRIISPPCWTDVIPQDPSGEQDLTPDCPWPRNPSPGATHIWQGPSASFFTVRHLGTFLLRRFTLSDLE